MISYRELINGFRRFNVGAGRPVLLHAAFSAFTDEVRGGPDSLIGALSAVFGGVMAPVFTYKTMLVPETGPANNASDYGSGRKLNCLAEFYTEDMPADATMGVTAEALRLRPGARRSMHPILSFAGLGLDGVLEAQNLLEPLAPLRRLMEQDSLVLLLGVDQRANTSIHLAELLAGRKQFLRWALTPAGVRECPGFTGCSEGFNQAQPVLANLTHWVEVGGAQIQAIELRAMVERLTARICEDPYYLLCGHPGCQLCGAVREDVERKWLDSTRKTPMRQAVQPGV